jgi:hypothetical protein
VVGARDNDSHAEPLWQCLQSRNETDMEELKNMMKTLLKQNAEDKQELKITRCTANEHR